MFHVHITDLFLVSAALSASDANLATAIELSQSGGSRQIGNGTVGNLEEHRRAVASHYMAHDMY